MNVFSCCAYCWHCFCVFFLRNLLADGCFFFCYSVAIVGDVGGWQLRVVFDRIV